MIVMAIIGVLAVVAIPSFVGAIKQAREAVLKESRKKMIEYLDGKIGVEQTDKMLKGLGVAR